MGQEFGAQLSWMRLLLYMIQREDLVRFSQQMEWSGVFKVILHTYLSSCLGMVGRLDTPVIGKPSS